MDIFVTLRHLDANDNEIFYTGTAGDPVPIVKGWLRTSLRKVDTAHPDHKAYLPHRNYFSGDVQSVDLDEIYTVDVEIWPTNVVLSKGDKLVLEVASGDTQGSGYFTHNHPDDRNEEKLKGWNNIHLGEGRENCLVLPVIPAL